ncbi:MAG: hypothetical protein ACJAQT_004589 [Akkermansiaceae bacterium]|jgi:hypothetical protein
MSLTRSAWKKHSPEDKFSDYILILPEDQVIISFTSMQTDEDKRVVWGCWIREEADSEVDTARKNATGWRRESYEIRDDTLTWNNGNDPGVSTWYMINKMLR